MSQARSQDCCPQCGTHGQMDFSNNKNPREHVGDELRIKFVCPKCQATWTAIYNTKSKGG